MERELRRIIGSDRLREGQARSVSVQDFRILFPADFDAVDYEHMAVRGVVAGVVVELLDGTRHWMTFMDLPRLAQEAASAMQRGEPCFTEEGLVIVPEATREAIEKAVADLWNTGFWTGGWRHSDFG